MKTRPKFVEFIGPAPDRVMHHPWVDGLPKAPADERCQRCNQVASYLVLSPLQTWICANCVTER